MIPLKFGVLLLLLLSNGAARAQISPAAISPAGSVYISEFMASNTGFLRDQDGDSPDWIELHNNSSGAVELEGWSLTDDTLNPRKWLFPKTNLAAQGYVVVFASGKNRRMEGAELHTSFNLAAGGEYLGLFNPAGELASEFAPAFPHQLGSVSFGRSGTGIRGELVNTESTARLLTPGMDIGTTWTALEFDDSAWSAATNGIGFEMNSSDFTGLIQTDVRESTLGNNASVYIRLPFVVENPQDLRSWVLRLWYDDGCIIYLNGEEMFRLNAPESPGWNSSATNSRANSEVLAAEEIELREFSNAIVSGTNVLAIHGLNASSTDGDFLIKAQLEAVSRTALMTGWRYFPTPTPGKVNNNGVQLLGPLIDNLAHAPNEPSDDEDLLVTALVRPAFSPVQEVMLHYRVMFTNELSMAMFDDGLHGDGAAGDGTYGAWIPADISSPGQMVRYRVSAKDSAENSSKWPPFFHPLTSPQYLGAVVQDPSITNTLPVVHWFVQNRGAAETSTGTRCSLFYNGEFYDNIFVRIRGGTSLSWPKKSYKLEFNEGAHFLLDPSLPRVSEFDLNTTYTDKSYVRAVLHYELQRDAGMPSPIIFHVRLHQNDAFYSVALYTEQPDADFLRRVGLDEQGALYKANPGSTYESPGTFEKKTRRTENRGDVTALILGLRQTGQALENFVMDNIDLPTMANYMATVAIAQNIDGSDKNHFLYRDTRGSGEWFMLPWDLDLSFGPNALNTDTMVYNQNYTSHPFIGVRPYLLHDGKYNRLLEAIFKVPRARQMVLRRIRTLTERFLDSGYLSNRIEQLVPLISRDVDLDRARWRSNAHFPGTTYSLRAANDRIQTNYLRLRGTYLKSKTIPGITSTNVDSQPLDASIEIAQVEFNPASGNQGEEFIELANTNDYPVELTGWKVTGAVTHAFKPATVIPANSTLFLTADARTFRARSNGPRGGQGLFVQGGYAGNLSARGGRLAVVNDQGTEVASFEYEGDPSPAQNYLRVTELMFHPAELTGDLHDAEEYEYMTLENIGSEGLDLNGVRFTSGVEYEFSTGAVTHLGPGETLYVVKNHVAFTERYGAGLPIVGEYRGQLSNSGERIALEDSNNDPVLDFTYSDRWAEAADGNGPALAIADAEGSYQSWTNALAWGTSAAAYGGPSLADSDGDGVSNFDEIVAGTNASDGTNKPGIEAIRFEKGELKLQFRAMAGRRYRVVFSDSLAFKDWNTLEETAVFSENDEVEITDRTPSGQGRFYRLLIWR